MKAYSRLVTQFDGRVNPEVMAEIIAIHDDGVVAGTWTWTPQNFLDEVTAANAESLVRDFLAAENDGCDVGDLEFTVLGVDKLRKALHLRHAGKQVVSAIAVALLISWAAITYL